MEAVATGRLAQMAAQSGFLKKGGSVVVQARAGLQAQMAVVEAAAIAFTAVVATAVVAGPPLERLALLVADTAVEAVEAAEAEQPPATAATVLVA